MTPFFMHQRIKFNWATVVMTSFDFPGILYMNFSVRQKASNNFLEYPSSEDL